VTSAWVFGSFFSQLRRAFLLLRQRISVQSRETSRFSTPRAYFVFVTLTLMQGKLVMVCVCRPLVYIHVPFNRSILSQPLRPKPGRRLKYLRGQSRGFVLLEKGTGAAETMLYQSCIGRARMETRPSKEHTQCACVWSNPEELQGKRRDRPKRYVTAL